MRFSIACVRFVYFCIERFTQTDINANALLMVIGGSEPVSTTLAFCLHELAINKHIQDKLRKHIFEIKEKHNGNFNNDYLMNLHYADMIITGIKIF